MAKAILNGVEINKFVVDGGGSCTGDTSGGLDFSAIGWDGIPAELQTSYDYAKYIYDNWDASITNRYNAFNGDKLLVLFPAVDMSQVTNMQDMFAKSSLTYFPANLNTSSATNMQYMFGECKSLTSLDVSSFDTSNVTNMQYMFSGCTNLTSLDLSSFNTSKVTNMQQMLNCENLKYVFGKIDCTSIPSAYNFNPIGYSQRPNIRYITFSNLGYQKVFNTTSGTERIANWGVNSDEVPNAKQSLVDTLLTYSFDRATAGYANCTISLHANSKAVLTEDEIAQITAKGFTIA